MALLISYENLFNQIIWLQIFQFKHFVRHLKLELLTQFPASNDEQICIFIKKNGHPQIEICDELGIHNKELRQFLVAVYLL